MAGRNYSSHKFSQVLRKDGTLDVDKLARECSRDVFEDKRHRRVDDMKKKAIGTSRDYDEFRNFVHCAEDMLEPVSSREMEELKRGRTGWAHTAAARATRRDRTAGAAGARFEPRRRGAGDARSGAWACAMRAAPSKTWGDACAGATGGGSASG